MRYWALGAAFLVLYAVETSLFGPAILWGLRPDLVLILVVTIALRRGATAGAAVGFAAGLVVDVLEGRLIGLGAAAKGLAGGCAGWVSRALFANHFLVLVILVFGASLLEHTFYLAGMWAFGLTLPTADAAFRVLLAGAIYDTVGGVLFYPLLDRAARALDVAEGVGSRGSVEG